MADSEKVFEVTDLNFGDEIEGSSGLTIIDFWAAWCGPCRMVAPIVAELAEDYSEQGLRVGKLDVDHEPPNRKQIRNPFHTQHSVFQRRESHRHRCWCRAEALPGSEGQRAHLGSCRVTRLRHYRSIRSGSIDTESSGRPRGASPPGPLLSSQKLPGLWTGICLPPILRKWLPSTWSALPSGTWVISPDGPTRPWRPCLGSWPRTRGAPGRS